MSILNLRALASNFRSRLGLPQGLRAHAVLSNVLINKQGEIGFYVDNDGNLVDNRGRVVVRADLRAVKEDFLGTDTTDQVSVILPSGLIASGATSVTHHIYTPGGNVFGWHPLGAGQTLLPNIVASGLDVACDQTSTEGSEIFTNFLGATGKPFIVGSDPAFYMRAKVLIGDISGLTSLCIGFRRAQVVQTALTSYADYSGLGLSTSANPGALKQLTGLNGTDVVTDTTQTLADATAYTVEVNVDATGNVTFRHDAATPGTLLAPTVTAAFQHDNGDPLIPFLYAIQGADLVDSLVIENFECGYQTSPQRP